MAAIASTLALAAPGGGTVGDHTYFSRAVRGTLHYRVYLPPGYASSRRRYPVLYVLHGLPAGPTAYRSISTVVSGLERSGREAIVVGAQGARDGDADAEWLDWGSGRDWETATASELVHLVDRTYRTVATRRGRALLGVSAGGYGAALIGVHHPRTYAVVESWSGYFHPTTPSGNAALDLGSKAANDRATLSAQVARLRARHVAGHAIPALWFYIGSGDARFRADNEATYAALRAARIPDVTFRVYPGHHDSTLWHAHAAAWVARAVSALAS